MEDLNERLQAFFRELRASAVPDVREYIETHPYKMNELLTCAKHIKVAIANNDIDRYNCYVNMYRQYYNSYNEEVAKLHYERLVKQFSPDANLQAQTEALSQLWTDSRYRKYLNVMCRLVNDETGEYVYLVADKSKAPVDEPYVTIDELPFIRTNKLDPWAYVLNRRSNEKSIINPVLSVV